MDAYSSFALPVPQALVPVTIVELVERRKASHPPPTVLCLSEKDRQLATPGGRVELSSGECKVLRHLVLHRDWCTAPEIARSQFGRNDPAGVGLVWKYVSSLRRTLAQHSGLVDSAPRRGYRLAQEIVLQGDDAPGKCV